MLTVSGRKLHRFCDGISRRAFLTVGTLGLGGLALGDVRRLTAQGALPVKAAPKAVIQVLLLGGPSHIDMYDMKPKAPAQYRGEFNPIRTSVPGIDLCEHMPLQAKITDKLAIVRNMSFGRGDHDYRQLLTGYPQVQPNQQPVALQRPDFGSVVSRLHDNGSGMPSYVSPMRSHLSPTYLGPAHACLPVGEAHPGVKNLALHPGVTLDRLADRKQLLRTFDTLRRDLDATGGWAGSDALNARGLDLISSNRVRDAFDISKEPKEVRARFGRWEAYLQARRLVEAGAQVVTLAFEGAWDTHQGNFKTLRQLLPQLDQLVYTLVTDLYERGLDKDVLVVVGGEMGRMPRIGRVVTAGAADGRDHWMNAGFVLMAGGGLRMGQAIGDTGPIGEGDTNKRYNLQNLYATLYQLFGIDPSTTLIDQTGRPHVVLEDRETISELF